MPKLSVTHPDGKVQTYELSDDKITVGRHPDNQVCIDDISVSGHHAEIVAKAGGFRLVDLGSTNGTRLNGETAKDEKLSDGDTIRFGKIEATCAFEAKSSAGSRPMPEAEKVEAKVGEESKKPTDFENVSPFKKKIRQKDPLGRGIMALAVVSVLAFVGAVAQVFLLKAP